MPLHRFTGHFDPEAHAALLKRYDKWDTVMEDNVRTVQDFRKMSHEQMEDVRKRALVGAGVQTGPGLEYWKKKAFAQ